MKIKLGSNIADARGKLNGHVFSKNRYGNYVRNKVTPVNPSTSYQAAVRNRLSYISALWAGLTAAQRSAWNAATGAWARTNIFGDLINPSGKTLHMKLNNELLLVDGTVISDPATPLQMESMTSMSLAIAAGAATMALTYAPAFSAGYCVKVYATPALSAGISFVKSEYRLIKVLTESDTSPYNLKAAWQARFGSMPAAGQKVFVKVVFVNLINGQAGIALSTSAITAA